MKSELITNESVFASGSVRLIVSIVVMVTLARMIVIVMLEVICVSCRTLPKH